MSDEPHNLWIGWAVTEPDGTTSYVRDLFPSVAASRGGVHWPERTSFTPQPQRRRRRERLRQRVERARIRLARWIDPYNRDDEDW